MSTIENHAAVTVSLNCSDAKSAALTYAIDSEPSNGTLATINQANGQVAYTPAGGFSGVDTFTYHAISANGVAESQTVSISVRPVVAVLTPANGAFTNKATPVFSGTASTGEEDADSVTVTVVSGPALSGTLVTSLQASVAPNGAWSVSPTGPLANGTYTVSAKISDAAGLKGMSAANTFTVDTVAPAVSITTPASCSSSTNASPTFSGKAANGAVDLPAVTVDVYTGIGTSGTPVQKLTATESGGA